MAISDDNKRLYVDTTDPDNPIGISLWEIMKCLGYYKRDTNGNRNLGMIIVNADINKLSRRKPLQYTDAVIPMDDAVISQKYNAGSDLAGNIGGMKSDTVKPTASSLYGLFANQNFNVFNYLRPNGNPYWYRMLDFDGYVHVAKYAITGSVPFTVEMTVDTPKVGGKVSLHIALGVAESSDIIDSSELLGVMGKYAGLVVRRSNGDTTLNNSYQMMGQDWFVITTSKPITSYTVGKLNQEDDNGLVVVHRPDSVHYTIDFLIPSASDLTNTAAGFDDFVGETVYFNPIMANGYIAWLDEGSSDIDLTKIALTNDAWETLAIELKDENYDALYVAPTISLDFTLAKNSANSTLVLSQLVATITTNHTASVQYTITINKISYTVEYLAGTDNGVNVWQPDLGGENGSSGGSITWGSGKILGPSTSGTLAKTDGGEYAYKHTGVTLRVSAKVFATVTYNGLSQTVYGSTTSKTISV